MSLTAVSEVLQIMCLQERVRTQDIVRSQVHHHCLCGVEKQTLEG